MVICYACLVEPTGAPLTEEHFLPEVIGGRRSFPILCQKHNSGTGHALDTALGELLQAFRVYLGLVPSSGKKPKLYHALPFKIDGAEYLMDSKGDAYPAKPVVQKTSLGERSFQISISGAPSDAELILGQIKAKFPNFSAGEFIPTSAKAGEDKNSVISVHLSSEKIRRAIAKIAVGFAVSREVPPKAMEPVIRYCIYGGSEEFIAHLSERVTRLLEQGKFKRP